MMKGTCFWAQTGCPGDSLLNLLNALHKNHLHENKSTYFTS